MGMTERKTMQYLEADKVFDDVKKTARLAKPSQVVAKFSSDIGEAVGTSYATDRQLKARIVYSRKKEYGFDVPVREFLEKLTAIDGDKFVLSGMDSADKIILGTKSNVKRLMDCSEWMSDGTFSVVPNGYCQLYTICGKIHKILVAHLFYVIGN